MSGAGLFVVGLLVTLIVAAALALLFYAAVLDGRYAAEQKLANEEHAFPDTETRSIVPA